MRNFSFNILFALIVMVSPKASFAQFFNFQNNAKVSTEIAAPQKQQQSIVVAQPEPTKMSSLAQNFVSFTESAKKFQFKFAQILNREVENIGNTVLFGFINDWWATRYRYGGTGKAGIDCSAYVGMLINSVYAIKLPRTAREQWAATQRVKLENMKEGDLVFFNTTGGISHVGVYLGDGYFTHSSSSQGVTISNLSETYFKSRFLGGGRVESNSEKAIEILRKMFVLGSK